jgi:hypothetical protein
MHVREELLKTLARSAFGRNPFTARLSPVVDPASTQMRPGQAIVSRRSGGYTVTPNDARIVKRVRNS